MTAGPPRLLRGLTRHRDHLPALFRAQGGRCPQTRSVSQDLLNPDGEPCIAEPCCFPLLQLGGEGAPPVAPRVHRPTVQGHRARHLAVGGSRRHRHKPLGAPHKTLGMGLTAGDVLSAGPWSCGERDFGRYKCCRRHGGGHRTLPSSECCNLWPICYHLANCMNTAAQHH